MNMQTLKYSNYMYMSWSPKHNKGANLTKNDDFGAEGVDFSKKC